MEKIAVISGVSSGVGLATASRFIIKGWKVIGLSRKEPDFYDLNFEWIQTDIKNYRSVESAFRSIIGNISILVNNASIFKMKPFEDFNFEEIDEIIDTNLKGSMYCTHEALKKMNSGRIINISSVSGTHGIENQAAYSASKFGINGFSESLNQETIKKGVLISTICPGGIDTPLWNSNNEYPGDRDLILKTQDIVNLIEFISDLPDRVIFKTATLFPKNEWH